MTTGEIVQRLVLRNQQRALDLKHYSGMRHYQLDYHGFPSKLSASMTVVATYDAPGRKEFQIVSQSGSALLRDSVFSKLLKTEKEASDDINRQHTLVDPENYNFKLVGLEDLAGRPAYVLEVEPQIQEQVSLSRQDLGGCHRLRGCKNSRTPGGESFFLDETV